MTLYWTQPTATTTQTPPCAITFRGESTAVAFDIFDSNATERPPDPLREHFRDRADWWREGTMFLSSPREIASHPAYQKIIAMGPRVVPFILEDLRDNGGDWYIALRLLVSDPPQITQDTAKSARKVVEMWLEWGRQRGYRL